MKNAALALVLTALLFVPGRAAMENASDADAISRAARVQTSSARGGVLLPRSGGRGVSGRSNANNQPLRFSRPNDRALEQANVMARFKSSLGEKGERNAELRKALKEEWKEKRGAVRGELREKRTELRERFREKKGELREQWKEKKEELHGGWKEKKEELRALIKEKKGHLRSELRGRSEYGLGLRELKAKLRLEGADPAAVRKAMMEYKATFFEGGQAGTGTGKGTGGDGVMTPEESPMGMVVEGENLRVRNRGMGRRGGIERRISPRLRRR